MSDLLTSTPAAHDGSPCRCTQRHKDLHRLLDELVACMVDNTSMLPSTTSVLELMEWSKRQAKL